MDPNALYYALSTIAQCAAALAALIGFLDLWRLDRLRGEREQAIQMIQRQLNFSGKVGLDAPTTLARLGDEYFVEKAEELVNELERGGDGPVRPPPLERLAARWRAIPGEQERLLHILHGFLRRTLVILALAIIGLVFANILNAWEVTALIARLLIILAGYRLWRDTCSVVREATRFPSTLLILTMGLFLVSPALAGETGKVTSPPSRTLIRSAPAGNVYAYENAAGETVEQMENRQGKLINRRFFRPAPPACAYLRSVGLGTDRYWRDDGEPLFHCLSPMTELGTVADPLGLGLKNNLAYYVDGDAEQIHKMLLNLDVNQRHEAKQAHQALLRAAKALTQQALNTPLPKTAEQAIMAGKPWRGTVKAAMLELTREDWPTGKGYDLKFLVRPAGQTP